MRLRIILAVTVAVILAGNVGSAQGQGTTEIVVPNALTSVEGTGSNAFPFNNGYPMNSARYQQVFNASEFGALTAPILITELRFRPDAIWGPSQYWLYVPSIQINLSTTAASADALSPTFEDNVGVDDTIVFNGELSFYSAVIGPAEGPMEFDIVVPLQVPFLYDRAAGSLLLDVRNFSSGYGLLALDAQYVSGDSTSRMYTEVWIGEDVTTPVGHPDTLGVVVQFTTEPPPITVSIDIKPGKDIPAINVGSGGSIPVAILSDEVLDAPGEVDRTSLTFGRIGSEVSLDFCSAKPEDVNKDGLLDLVCHFKVMATGFLPGDELGVLRGLTSSGARIEGADAVKIVR